MLAPSTQRKKIDFQKYAFHKITKSLQCPHNKVLLQPKLFEFEKIIWKIKSRWVFIIPKQFFRQSMNHFALKKMRLKCLHVGIWHQCDVFSSNKKDEEEKSWKAITKVILATFRQYSNGNYLLFPWPTLDK